MATEAEDWLEIAANIRAEVKGESARRAALVAAGQPAPTTITVDGRSISINDWYKQQMEAAQLAEDRAAALEPYEIHEHGY